MAHEGLDPTLEVEVGLDHRRDPLVHQSEEHPLVEEGEFTEAGGDGLPIELCGHGEDLGVRPEAHGRPPAARLAVGLAPQLRGRDPARVLLPVDPAVSVDHHLHPFRERIDHRKADPVEAA